MSTQHEKELYLRVDEVLHYLWDPIGVSGMPMARDEYQSYVPQVVTLLNESANAEQIVSYLNEVVTKRMGLSENADAALQVVAVLLDWKAVLTAAWGR
jgi:hypothetical protein